MLEPPEGESSRPLEEKNAAIDRNTPLLRTENANATVEEPCECGVNVVHNSGSAPWETFALFEDGYRNTPHVLEPTATEPVEASESGGGDR